MEAPTIGDDCSTGASLCIAGMQDANSPGWTDVGVVRSSAATQHDPITGLDKPVTFVAYVEVKNCVASCVNVATNTKYAYWLYNDSIPVPTTYCLNLTNCPNPAPVSAIGAPVPFLP